MSLEIENLPSISGWSIFKNLGFSDYIALKQCTLRAMSKNLEPRNAIPKTIPNKAALLGKFHHVLMELIYQCESEDELNDAIERHIILLQQEVNTWPHLKSGSVSGWDEVNLSATTALREFKKLGGSDINSISHSEKKLSSHDGILIGRPDFFTIKEQFAVLRELKTSALYNGENVIRPEYKEQLFFYALLLFDNYELQKVSAILVSSKSERYEIEISKIEVEEYRKSVLEKLHSVNEAILELADISKFSTPNKEACENCSLIAICPGYKKNQFALGMTKDKFVLEGFVRNLTEKSTKSISAIIESFPDKAETEIILPITFLDSLRLNDFYILSDLYFNTGKYNWGEKSRILKIA